MKAILTLCLCLSVFLTSAQLKKATMAPIMAPGYYVNFKGDTVKGEIQVNPPSESDFYKQFSFKSKNRSKAKIMFAQKVSAYGFDDRNFVRVDYRGKKEFIERLVNGRLRFYESKYSDNPQKESDVEPVFFVRDIGADTEDAELKELRKINPRSYKKNLKPYMKDQEMIWSDLDKFNFDKQALIKAIKEFNQNYSAI